MLSQFLKMTHSCSLYYEQLTSKLNHSTVRKRVNPGGCGATSYSGDTGVGQMRPEADGPFTSTLYKWVRPGAPQGRTKGKPQGQLTMIRIIGISYPKMWQLQRLRFFILQLCIQLIIYMHM